MANQFAERIDTERLAVRLERLTHEMRQADDTVNADKLLQLSAKARDGEIAVAFCVHFSSAKSTMINTLLGKELLPSNPIPTSANVVKIRAGEPAARVYTHRGTLLRSRHRDGGAEAIRRRRRHGGVGGDRLSRPVHGREGKSLGHAGNRLDRRRPQDRDGVGTALSRRGRHNVSFPAWYDQQGWFEGKKYPRRSSGRIWPWYA